MESSALVSQPCCKVRTLKLSPKLRPAKSVLKQAERVNPDVILLDVRMPDGDGLETLEKLRQKVPNSKVVMLSTYDNPTYIARAVTLARGLRAERLDAGSHH